MLRGVKRFAKRIRALVLRNQLLFNIKKNSSEIKKVYNDDKKINVIFFMQFPEMWNSCKTVYESMNSDNRFKVKIICIPKKKGMSTMSKVFLEKNEAAEFCKANNYSYETYEESKKFVEYLEGRGYLFLQRPYDDDLPVELKMNKIFKYCKICYIPYGYEFANGIHLDIEYNYKLLAYTYFFFSENNDTFEYVKNKSKHELIAGSRKILKKGYPRFDLIKGVDSKRQLKTFLWLPRWSVKAINDKSNFLNYFRCLVDYFENHKDFKLIIRPHPLMFDNFIAEGVISIEEANEIKNIVNQMKNVYWDINSDYTLTFYEADALIADYTSLIIEFFLTKKPIIYCGEYNNFNTIGRELVSGMYTADKWEELKVNMDRLIIGDDTKRNEYSKIVDKIWNPSCFVGESIKNEIFNDVEK